MVRLALAFAPNGDLLVTNGDAVNPDPTIRACSSSSGQGAHSSMRSRSTRPKGRHFGLAVKKVGQSFWLATANDDTNTLDIRVASKSNLTSASSS